VDPTAERDFTEFVAQRSYRLLQVAYALTGNQHEAQDLVQSALAKAVSRWSHVRTNPEMYVRRVLYHEFVNWWRRPWRRREAPVAVLPGRVADRDPSGDTELRMVLRDALDLLTPRQRAVLVLRYLEDLSEQQVAEVLGCSPGTVGSQASRALARLRAVMGPEATSPASTTLTGPSRRRRTT
jgi:RNA polymerase sigma-70 factor (sigma-E family)